jgi:hypothetical protein
MPMVIQDIQVGAPSTASVTGAKVPHQRQKPNVMTYARRNLRAGFAEPEYNLHEIQQAMDTESFLRLSFDKHEELILKDQWSLVGKNKVALNHVWKRLTEISWGQGDPLERIIEAGIEDIVESSNAFYVFARRETGPKYKSRWGRTLYPITGIFSPNAATMKPFVETDRRGIASITKWQQVMDGILKREFRTPHVAHMAFRKRKGHIFGTPYVIPVLDDILALRRIEELQEVLVHKHAFPFFQYRVGTETDDARVYDNGMSEVDDVRTAIAGMPYEGGIVTPYRHEIIVLSTKNKAVNADPLLKHYEARVLSGLNLSGIDIGRGETANRGTAQTMSKGLADRCTRITWFFASQFTFHILDELLLEIGIIPTPDNRVYLKFPVIDKEEKRAHENHIMALYQGNLLTEEESRIELDREPLTEEQRDDLFIERISVPLAEAQAEATANNAFGSPAATANRSQPTNKSGKKPVKKKVSANDAQNIAMMLWDQHQGTMLSDFDGVDAYFLALLDMLSKQSHIWLNDGLNRYKDEHNPSKPIYIGTNVHHAFVSDVLQAHHRTMRTNTATIVSSMTSYDDRVGALRVQREWIQDMCRALPSMGADYGYARAAQADKHEYVRWSMNDIACADCQSKATKPIQIHRFSYGELRHHADCISHLIVASPK